MLYGEVVITAENGTVSPSTVFLQTGSDTKTVTVTSTSDEDIKVTAAPGSNGLGDIDENPITGSQKLTIKVNKANTSTDNNQGNQNTNTGNNINAGNTTTASKSTEARLSNFGIKPNDFSGFKRDKTEYSTEVPNNVTKVNVYATALDKNAKVSGAGDVQLKEGENTVKVTVTAEAGNTKVYTLTIKRRTAAEDATATTNDDTTTTNTEATTSDAFGLESLDIKDVKLKPSFKTEIYKYEIDLDKDLSQLDISTIPTDDDTTVEIAGNEDLKDGENLITIVVANKKTKETATYQIKVTIPSEVASSPQNNIQFYLMCGTIILAAIVVIGIIVSIYKKKNKTEVDYKEPKTDNDMIDPYTDIKPKKEKVKSGKHSN